MLRPALILATTLAISSTAHAAWKNPLGKDARQGRAAQRTANKPDAGRDEAFATLQTEHGRILSAARGQVTVATLKTSPRLQWTRDILERPESDWGPEGVGTPFAEKRSALVNLRWANGNARVMRSLIATLESGHTLSSAQRRWVSSATREIDQLEADAGEAREGLRGTGVIWHHQKWAVFGAKADQRATLRAMLVDGPDEQAEIDAHVSQYERTRR